MNDLRIVLAALLLAVFAGCAAPTPEFPPGHSPSILARGAEISGANGMQFGPDGLLYVASVFGSEIVVLDPETGRVERRIRDGVKSPDDIAFSSDGSFYWTSILSGEVAGYRPDGSFVIAAELTPGTNPITFSDDDRLFVSQCFFDDKLYEVDPDGIEAPRLISDELGPHCGLNGMDWGPDGRLYGPRWFRGEIVSFDVDTREMRLEATGFEVPAAIKFDSLGRLNVLDTGAGTVTRMTGQKRETIARLEPGLDNLVFDAQDRLFVSSFIDGSVTRVDADGTQTEIAPGGLAIPGGLTLRQGAQGLEVVVADFQAIRAFDAASGAPGFVHRNVFGVSELGSITNISTDDARLILTSWLDGTVKIWDPETEKVVTTYGGLSNPISAVRYAGRIFVAEQGKRRIIAFGREDTHRFEVIVSGLKTAAGLVEREGGLYVTDRATGQILKVAQKGSPLKGVEVVATGLMAPEGIAATDRGFLVVEAATGRVVEVDLQGQITPYARIAPGTEAPTETQPPSLVFNGIVVGADGVAYATGETTRVLYRIEP